MNFRRLLPMLSLVAVLLMASAMIVPEQLVHDSQAKGFVVVKNNLEKCDTIEMKDGSKFKAMVTEVRTSEIYYKKCDDTEGPTFSIKKSQVSAIHYADGRIEEFENKVNKSTTTSKDNSEEPKTDPLAIAALATGGAGVFLLFTTGFMGVLAFLAAGVMGLISLRNIKRSKGKLKGKGLASAGVAIGIGGLAIIALVVLLVVVLVATIP